jgi:hypothetical protein
MSKKIMENQYSDRIKIPKPGFSITQNDNYEYDN